MHQSEITRLYKGVIEDVIKNVRNDFVNMGVDEQVLYDLQMLWEQKLMDYKIVSPAEYFGNVGNLMMAPNGQMMPQFSPQRPLPHLQQQQQVPHDNINSLNILANGAIAAAPQPTDPYGYIKPTNNRNTYYHPSQGYFEAASSGIAPPSAANLPSVAPFNNNNNKDTSVKPPPPSSTSKQNPRRYDGTGDEEKPTTSTNNEPDDIMKLLYTNGDEELILDKTKNDSSETSAAAALTTATVQEDDEINSDLDDDDEDDENDADGEGYDESGTMDENVVLCQYEKVSRTRNKWRCVFKSGIIHVNGTDYVFSKANGEFEW